MACARPLAWRPSAWPSRSAASGPRPAAAALDPDREFNPAEAGPDVVAGTDAVLTQGQLIGVLQELARPGDVVIAAAGGPPGDLLKVWDATRRPHCHLEFGYSCMGYEIPAAIGVRLAEPVTPEAAARVISFLGDGTFLLAPTELVTAAQEGLAAVTRRPRKPRLSGHSPAADAAQRTRVRQRVPVQGRAAAAGRRGRRRRRRAWRATTSALTWCRSRPGLGALAPAARRPRPNCGTRCPARARSPRPGGDRGAGHPCTPEACLAAPGSGGTSPRPECPPWR